MKTAAIVWLVGSLVTLGVAYALWREGQRVAAAEVIVLSPFPCPTGLPC